MICISCKKNISIMLLKCNHCGAEQKLKHPIIKTVEDCNVCHTVGNELVLDDAVFIYKGTKYPYAEIENIYFENSSISINLVRVSGVSLKFSIKDKSITVSLKGNASILGRKKMNSIIKAYEIVSRKSFKSRIAPYIDSLEQMGYVYLAKEVKLYKNGNIEKGRTNLSLQKALKNNTLYFSTNFIFGSKSSSNLYEFLISETGTSVLSNRIIFTCKNNHDIATKLISHFSQSKS